jgi:hypothetical protein
MCVTTFVRVKNKSLFEMHFSFFYVTNIDSNLSLYLFILFLTQFFVTKMDLFPFFCQSVLNYFIIAPNKLKPKVLNNLYNKRDGGLGPTAFHCKKTINHLAH